MYIVGAISSTDLPKVLLQLGESVPNSELNNVKPEDSLNNRIPFQQFLTILHEIRCAFDGHGQKLLQPIGFTGTCRFGCEPVSLHVHALQ